MSADNYTYIKKTSEGYILSIGCAYGDSIPVDSPKCASPQRHIAKYMAAALKNCKPPVQYYKENVIGVAR